jgi:protein TonB
VYPARLKSEGVGGLVTVAYDVSDEGKVENLRVIRSEPPGLFDAAASQAVASWQFKPQIRNGIAEPVLGLTSKLEFRAP